MKILISNDDGYDAPGLAALYRALANIGDVTVVAPSTCHSSKAHAVVVDRPLTVETCEINGMPNVHVCDGTPADCIRVGLKTICESRPDLVVTGINPGANLGVDVFYSGTVAAAREAAIFRLRAIAVSRYMRRDVEFDWAQTERLTTISLQRVLREDAEPGEYWNINLPAIQPHESPRGFAFVPQSTEEQPVEYQPAKNSTTKTRVLDFSGDYSARPAQQEADVRYVFDGYVTVTKLQLDTTRGSAAPRITAFE